MNNKLKIISGKYKSRIITIPNKPNLKPTKTYIRESIFNVINIDNCKSSLDLFSGSGILSFEALSRGVNNIILVEQDKDLTLSIKSNLSLLGEKDVTIVNKKVERFLINNKKYSFDIIFIDAPFNTSLLKETLSILKEYGYLDNNMYLYFERSKKDEYDYQKYIIPSHKILKDLCIGDVSYTISVNRNI